MGLLDALVWLLRPLINYLAKNHRALAMVVVVLPLSFAYSSLLKLSDFVVGILQPSRSGKRSERVERVQKHVRARLSRPESERRKLCTSRKTWQNLSTRFASYKNDADCVHVSDFRNILSLDEKNLTIDLEPLVTVGEITSFLLKRGYMLATTLEIREATIGGLAMAVGMTTASHKFGLLSETVEEYEVVLGSGDLAIVREDNEHVDLFHALPWSHGTLGLLLRLRLKIIPVTPIVEVTFTPISTGLKDISDQIKVVSLADSPADFVEATIFSRDKAVVMEGRFVAKAPPNGCFNDVSKWWKPWFFAHVRSKLDGGITTEYMPVEPYIFRHDRSLFWTLKDQLPESIGNAPLFRFFLGWLLPPRVGFLKLGAVTPELRHEMQLQRVYQDIVLPLDSIEKAVEKAAHLFEIWPLLIYPCRLYQRPGQFPKPTASQLLPGKDFAMYMDLGVYGIPRPIMEGKTFKIVSAMREMEDFTRNVRGAPFLYADVFMSRDEFGKTFNLDLYDKVRKQYEADKHFPHLYQKTAGCQSFDWTKILKQEQEVTHH